MTKNNFTEIDTQFMKRALELAAEGRFTTHPNPNVGCVIVDFSADTAGEIVGEGFHLRAGEAHAEVNALAEAGDRAKGATAYVTLEPCNHTGRTPPCVDALIKADVARVVVAMEDPFPKVAGAGVKRLKKAGIKVEMGLLEREAYAVSRGFFTQQKLKRPFVQLKMAASLDGRTALANGKSKWITERDARCDVQVGRAQAGAILTGAGTILADDPALNVRHTEFPNGVEYPGEPGMQQIRQPVRVIIDHRGEVQPSANVFKDGGPVWLIRTKASGMELPENAEEIIMDTGVTGRVDLTALLQLLAKRDIHTVWVEGGARLAGAMLTAELVDELIVYTAPKLMGDHGVGMFHLGQITSMDNVPVWEFSEITQVGVDVKMVLQKTAGFGLR
ncbi:riboflavin biosynthesis protein RibD [Aliidiomarina iranensis]|uniref:Riboflavin biosynthesis protein RibD n=1 Tax=Aliidiomarina iranensis TaxID=1434071 RepID=A0A432VPV3_9GAMM|nr:bifunctional diaminohydroxyphosphoribosylaminopyrimidine deaminase/5-amino-6-(5-phosphoribosylamino)uracil reductase RibD [Aliidiomarina iranensis]RUO18196.1 riboflavin biosynthesis protein RibD [Aliidiomarina iranensis]